MLHTVLSIQLGFSGDRWEVAQANVERRFCFLGAAWTAWKCVSPIQQPDLASLSFGFLRGPVFRPFGHSSCPRAHSGIVLAMQLLALRRVHRLLANRPG